MNATLKNIFATVIAGAIIGLCSILWQFNDRLARIETTLATVVSNQAEFKLHAEK